MGNWKKRPSSSSASQCTMRMHNASGQWVRRVSERNEKQGFEGQLGVPGPFFQRGPPTQWEEQVRWCVCLFA